MPGGVALGEGRDQSQDEAERARAALALADSALYVWPVMTALLTLVEWLV